MSQHRVELEQPKEPFETRVFTEAALIRTFAEAMNKSRKLSGELDWAPDLNLKIVYGDGYTEEYSLALGNQDQDGQQGLLVSAGNSSQGYVITEKNTSELRDLIYGDVNATGSDTSEPITGNVSVMSPITVSRNELYPITKRAEFLDLRLMEGTYSEDWATPGPLTGRSWSGRYHLVVSDEQGKMLSHFPLSEHFADELAFNDFFQIQFDDYNGDGDPDFTIGQYGTSNGFFYKLFTLHNNNVIEELSIKPGSELFISSPEKGYSIKLDKIDEHSFKRSYYDNSLGKQVENVFRWDGDSFQRVGQ